MCGQCSCQRWAGGGGGLSFHRRCACNPLGQRSNHCLPLLLQELRAPILALRAFNVETALIAEHAKTEPLVMMRCQVRRAVGPGFLCCRCGKPHRAEQPAHPPVRAVVAGCRQRLLQGQAPAAAGGHRAGGGAAERGADAVPPAAHRQHTGGRPAARGAAGEPGGPRGVRGGHRIAAALPAAGGGGAGQPGRRPRGVSPRQGPRDCQLPARHAAPCAEVRGRGCGSGAIFCCWWAGTS